MKGKRWFSILTALLLVAAVPLALAEDVYGTYAEGFFTQKNSFQLVEPTAQLMNADFSEGLRYWTTRTGNKTNENARLVEENGNVYIQLTPIGEYHGITTSLFVCEQAQPGQKLVVLYDWRGSMDFRVGVSQWLDGKEILFTNPSYGGKVLYESIEENGWHVSASMAETPVQPPANEGEPLYFSVTIESRSYLNIDTCVDNIRLAVQQPDGSYQDFDGNPVVFAAPEMPDDEESESSANRAEISQADTEKGEKNFVFLLTGLTAAAVVIAVAVLIVVLKKKRVARSKT